jgi:hypothetical protein
LLIKLKDHLRRAKPFGNCHHNYSVLLTAVSSGDESSLENLGIPQLFELADLSTNGERFFGTILSIIGIISIDSFGTFLLSLASMKTPCMPQQTQILQPPQSDSSATPVQEAAPRPFLVFFELLLQSTRRRNAMAENKALLQLYPIFAAHFQAISDDHQHWLLFFALPSALSRHVDSGNKPAAKTLQVLRRQHQTITTTATLDASIGALSMKLTLHPSSDDVDSGWAVFLAPDVDQFDFAKYGALFKVGPTQPLRTITPQAISLIIRSSPCKSFSHLHLLSV